jgi:hypothetical protein
LRNVALSIESFRFYETNTYKKDTVALIDLDQRGARLLRLNCRAAAPANWNDFALLIRSLRRQKQAGAAGCEKEHGGFGRPCEKWAQRWRARSIPSSVLTLATAP